MSALPQGGGGDLSSIKLRFLRIASSAVLLCQFHNANAPQNPPITPVAAAVSVSTP
jgi:hypothetical protein